MTLDPTTMALALALANLLFAAVLLLFDTGAGQSAARPTLCRARLLQGAAWLLLWLGAAASLSEVLAVASGYSLLFCGVALESGALAQAAARARWPRARYALLGVALAVFLIACAVDAAGPGVVVALLVLGALYLRTALALAGGWQSASRLRRCLALGCAVLAFALAARGVLVLLLPPGWGWLSHALLHQLSVASLYLLALLTGFGGLLLAREQLQRELDRLQVVDPLADCPNRHGFFSALAPWMALARRPGLSTALVVLDIDQFKRVNDSYGHPAGDMVLRHVAAVCRQQLRDSDQLGRVAGGEFAVLLPRTGAEEAGLVAERMRAALAASPVKTARALVTMTASFGITTIRADDSTVTLFQRAEEALRAAKRAGRNRVQQATPPVAVEA